MLLILLLWFSSLYFLVADRRKCKSRRKKAERIGRNLS